MERDDALSALTEVEGDWTNLRSDANGALWVIPSGTVAVSNAGLTELAAAIDTEVQVDVVGALPAGNNNIGDVDVASIAAGDNNIGNVDIASIAAGDNNIGNVDVVTLPSIPAGTNNIGDVDVLSIAAGDNNIGNVDIVSGTITTVSTLTGGGVAHGSGDSGNPVKVGSRAISANITAETANDRVDQLTDLLGYQLVRPYALNQTLWQDTVGPITDTTGVELKAAGAANVRNYITSLLVTNSDASVGTNVVIQDGDGGTTMWEGWAAAGGGFSCSFPTPLRGTAATAIYVDCGTTSSETRVSACGFQAID
jgi:hypothetical protein